MERERKQQKRRAYILMTSTSESPQAKMAKIASEPRKCLVPGFDRRCLIWDLPNELLLRVFYFVSAANDDCSLQQWPCAVRLVCRRFNAIITDNSKSLCHKSLRLLSAKSENNGDRRHLEPSLAELLRHLCVDFRLNLEQLSLTDRLIEQLIFAHQNDSVRPSSVSLRVGTVTRPMLVQLLQCLAVHMQDLQLSVDEEARDLVDDQLIAAVVGVGKLRSLLVMPSSSFPIERKTLALTDETLDILARQTNLVHTLLLSHCQITAQGIRVIAEKWMCSPTVDESTTMLSFERTASQLHLDAIKQALHNKKTDLIQRDHHLLKYFHPANSRSTLVIALAERPEQPAILVNSTDHYTDYS